MKRYALCVILCGGLVSLGFECNDCPECPPQVSINGNYLGSYEVVEIHSGDDTVQALGQPVYVEFRKPEFSLELTPGVAESLRVVCDLVGTYVLGKGVSLKCSRIDSANGCADTLLYPNGYFALDQTTDTLRLTRDTTVAGSIRYIKRLALLPAVR